MLVGMVLDFMPGVKQPLDVIRVVVTHSPVQKRWPLLRFLLTGRAVRRCQNCPRQRQKSGRFPFFRSGHSKWGAGVPPAEVVAACRSTPIVVNTATMRQANTMLETGAMSCFSGFFIYITCSTICGHAGKNTLPQKFLRTSVAARGIDIHPLLS